MVYTYYYIYIVYIYSQNNLKQTCRPIYMTGALDPLPCDFKRRSYRPWQGHDKRAPHFRWRAAIVVAQALVCPDIASLYIYIYVYLAVHGIYFLLFI